jgi:hypothetical protein
MHAHSTASSSARLRPGDADAPDAMAPVEPATDQEPDTDQERDAQPLRIASKRATSSVNKSEKRESF